MATESEVLKLSLPDVGEAYDIAVFNQNFTKLDAYAKTTKKDLSQMIDATKTFDVWAGTKGIEYTATLSTSGGYDLVTEQVHLSGTLIAQRVTEELANGFRVTTTLNLPSGQVSKSENWTELQNGWKGVVS